MQKRLLIIFQKIALLFALLILSAIFAACSDLPGPKEDPVRSATPTSKPSIPSPTIPITLEKIAPTATQPPQSTPEDTVVIPSTITLTQTAPVTVSPDVDSVSQSTEISQPIQPDCVDQAVFIKDVTVPDGTLFEPNVAFTKTWRIQNRGTCTWGLGYALIFASGDIMNAELSNSIPAVKPGDFADISIELTSPSRFGEKTGNWLLQNAAGDQFGMGVPSTGQLWVQINVVSAASGNTQVSDVGQATALPADGGCATQGNPAYESEILALINQARSANGLGSVTLQSQLSAAALAHSKDMACVGFVDHSGSNGSSWYDRVAAQGYANYVSARENIYVGDPAFGGDANGAFDWWMNSQVHRDNILYANITQVGIGYVYLTGSPYGGYYTLLLARP